MIAHKRECDGKEQTCGEHSRNVSELCYILAKKVRLVKLAKLCGLLHDYGKFLQDFGDYLRKTGSKHPLHAGLGALYVWKRWGESANTASERRTAQILSLCIYGHHAGLPDCLDVSGHSPFLDGLREQNMDYYVEAMENFYQEAASAEELDQLFREACRELDEFEMDHYSFEWGMLVRLLLSILVDADRWDTACFEYDTDPFDALREDDVDWGDLLSRLETYLETFPKEGELAKIRRDISEWCKTAGEWGPGIYSLSVPTGGGKTYSSLRWALTQAERNGYERIFYVISMNTILDQNAQDIRTALRGYPSILEHHSNVVLEDEEDEDNYHRLTERWGSRLILTSLVQFLDTLFRKENSKARRMHQLANSVLVFDEIQTLPPKCRELFKQAIQFLVRYCHCTVLLCTATQPELGLEAKELVPDVKALYRKLKRVTYIPQLKARKYDDAAFVLASFVQERNSVLMVVNTKEAAWNIFQRLFSNLGEEGYGLLTIERGLSEQELKKCAQECGENEILCVHLSTLMCPAHRKEILRWIKIWLSEKKLVCCVSTTLIEAGINVSFPIVVRSVAGIPSMIQAAGRCNRNCEKDTGYVYLWYLAEEKLGYLPEIQTGREISMKLIGSMEKTDEIGMPEMVQRYFLEERNSTQRVEKYLYKKWNSNLVMMLSENNVCKNAAGDRGDDPKKYFFEHLYQSFRTAGTVFRVIDQETRSVLVPYGKGKELIKKLCGSHTLSEEIRYLREAQQYSVNLYDQIFSRLAKEGGLFSVGESGAVALREEYYDEWSGIITTAREMEELIL